MPIIQEIRSEVEEDQFKLNDEFGNDDELPAEIADKAIAAVFAKILSTANHTKCGVKGKSVSSTAASDDDEAIVADDNLSAIAAALAFSLSTAGLSDHNESVSTTAGNSFSIEKFAISAAMGGNVSVYSSAAAGCSNATRGETNGPSALNFVELGPGGGESMVDVADLIGTDQDMVPVFLLTDDRPPIDGIYVIRSFRQVTEVSRHLIVRAPSFEQFRGHVINMVRLSGLPISPSCPVHFQHNIFGAEYFQGFMSMPRSHVDAVAKLDRIVVHQPSWLAPVPI